LLNFNNILNNFFITIYQIILNSPKINNVNGVWKLYVGPLKLHAGGDHSGYAWSHCSQTTISREKIQIKAKKSKEGVELQIS
jgi:hypothetical protein